MCFSLVSQLICEFIVSNRCVVSNSIRRYITDINSRCVYRLFQYENDLNISSHCFSRGNLQYPTACGRDLYQGIIFSLD